jgi:hypothetical protein
MLFVEHLMDVRCLLVLPLEAFQGFIEILCSSTLQLNSLPYEIIYFFKDLNLMPNSFWKTLNELKYYLNLSLNSDTPIPH